MEGPEELEAKVQSLEEVGGEVPEAEVGSSEDPRGGCLGGRKDQWCFQATCEAPCPQLLDTFKWMVVSLGFR